MLAVVAIALIVMKQVVPGQLATDGRSFLRDDLIVDPEVKLGIVETVGLTVSPRAFWWKHLLPHQRERVCHSANLGLIDNPMYF